ncbi:hypothetical protein Cflav_PD3158 [Pedosphaera parvula Ellin514]|uniref:Uncharacterized protein n=1 Tax=Pedosphaera parvula (strain Ellin514) TaxID=320771 RepID=B9XJ61_PEDPL|nr:hypothetical protein Cflav_PD3158 [Pedosphaera parvula Ellin514]
MVGRIISLGRFQVLSRIAPLYIGLSLALTGLASQGPVVVPSKDYSHWPPCFAGHCPEGRKT